MNPPSHVPWNQSDPGYAGDFDVKKTFTMVVSGSDIDLDMYVSRTCFLYNIAVVTSSANPYLFKLYSKTARAAGDLIFSSGEKTGNWTYIQGVNQPPVISVDEGGTANVYVTIEGTNGDSFDVTLKIVRIR